MKDKTFLIIMIFVGLIFSVLIPLYQVPDELTHINMTYKEMGQEKDFDSIINNSFDTLRIMRNPDEKVNSDLYFNFNEKLNQKVEINIPNIHLIRHLPQSIGLFIGEIFNLPVLLILLLCEGFAVLFYSFNCFLSLKILPFKKNIMKYIMLLPICIQQMGSFSYDVVLISISFLYISYILYLKFTKEKITLYDLLILLALLSIIFLCKIPYIILCLLLILLPIKKIDIKLFKFKINEEFILNNKKKIIFTIILFFFILFLFALKLLNNLFYGRVFLSFLKYPFDFIDLILRSANNFKIEYITTIVGKFGWLDTYVSKYYAIFIIISGILFLFFNHNGKNIEKQLFKKWEIIFIIILFIFSFLIIILSMFEWTLYITGVPNYENYSIKEIICFVLNNNFVIGGVQGRYFIPILPLICIPIYNFKITSIIYKIKANYFQYLYFVILILYMFIVILKRYWV